jgi:hypothetical protein
LVRAFFLAAVLFATAASAQTQANPLAPLDFLRGCWRGTFANAPGLTDEHCFAPMLGGRYLRDTHAVRGDASGYAGESIYAFDYEVRRITHTYYAVDGGTSRGFVDVTPEGLSFPADRYVGGDGVVLNMRTRWVKDGPARFTTITEVQNGAAWTEFMRMTFVRAPDLTPPS